MVISGNFAIRAKVVGLGTPYPIAKTSNMFDALIYG